MQKDCLGAVEAFVVRGFGAALAKMSKKEVPEVKETWGNRSRRKPIMGAPCRCNLQTVPIVVSWLMFCFPTCMFVIIVYVSKTDVSRQLIDVSCL